MKKAKNLLFIHYPSGGYGFYLTRLINRYVSGIVKVHDSFDFDHLGTSHSLPLVYGDVHFNQNRILHIDQADPIYHNDISQGLYTLIPYCPGINDDKIQDTLNYYPDCKVVRLCYDDRTWPLVFYNAIVKAKQDNINRDVFFDREKFGSDADWAKRENFSLLCKHHSLRSQWKMVTDYRILNIDIFALLTNPGRVISDIAQFVYGKITYDDLDLKCKHQAFLAANPATAMHLEILQISNELGTFRDLGWIKELFWQAVTNFYVEEKYNITIKVNDHPDWFTNTKNIVELIPSFGDAESLNEISRSTERI